MIVLLLALALVVLGLLGHLALRSARSLREVVPAARQTAERAVARARRAGAEDMRTAWLRAQFGVLPPQHRTGDEAFITAGLAATPWLDGDVTRLRRHGQALWALRDVAARTALGPEVEARLDLVAALVFDATDEEFDTGLGQTGGQYLYHPDSTIRSAYLAGGSQGVEAIMAGISEARARVRRDAATRAAADALTRQRNAALGAMRETRRTPGSGDAHTAWEEQAKRIGQ